MQRASITESVSALFEQWEGVRQQLYAAEMQLADEVVSGAGRARVASLEQRIHGLGQEADQLFAAAMRMFTETPSANDAAASRQARHH